MNLNQLTGMDVERLELLSCRAQDISRESSVPIEAAGVLRLCSDILDGFVHAYKIAAADSAKATKPAPDRVPRRPTKAASAPACPLGERHRYKDGRCACGATRNGVPPLSVVDGVAKQDPPSRSLHGTEVHVVRTGEPEALCGVNAGALLSAQRTDEPGDATCGDCRELAS